MIKKTLLVTCMFAAAPVFSGNYNAPPSNVVIGVEKPRYEYYKSASVLPSVGTPVELKAEAELGVPLERSEFYKEDSALILADEARLKADFDWLESNVSAVNESVNATSEKGDSGGKPFVTSNNIMIVDKVNRSGQSDSAVKPFVASSEIKLVDKVSVEPSLNDVQADNKDKPYVSVPQVMPVVESSAVDSYERKLKGTPSEFLMVTNPNERVFISSVDGKVYFHAKKGTLEDNLNDLLSVTNTVFPLIYEVSSQHVNSTDVWIHGETVLDVLNTLLINYVDPHPIRASTYANRIIEIYYDKKNRQQ